MKKRKAPVLLLTLLVLLVGGVLVYGMSGNSGKKTATDMPVTDEGREAPSSGEMAKTVQKNTPQRAHPTAVTPGGAPAPSGPTVGLPEHLGQYPKPKQNPDGSTSSQWYSKPEETSR